MMSQKYSALFYYLTCYLNQDYDVIFGGDDDALLAYKVTETKEEVHNIIKDIQSLIDSTLNEKELEHLILNEFDCNFYYPSKWESTRKWLIHLLSVLQN